MGPKYKRSLKNYCKWCGKPTIMEEMLLSDTPILEFMEEKINEHGRKRIWGEDGDWSEEMIDSDFEAELLVYDEMLNTYLYTAGSGDGTPAGAAVLSPYSPASIGLNANTYDNRGYHFY